MSTAPGAGFGSTGVMSSRVLTRVLLSVLAGALCGVAVTCGVLVVGQGDPVRLARPAAEASPAPASSDVRDVRAGRAGRAREVLRRWDAARARAWTTGDTEALAGLYTPGSVAGLRDVAMLRAWTERGARLTGLTTQVLRLQVLVERPRRLVLVVTDRVAQVQAGPAALPQDRPSTRRLVLTRPPRGTTDGSWCVESVSPVLRGRS